MIKNANGRFDDYSILTEIRQILLDFTVRRRIKQKRKRKKRNKHQKNRYKSMKKNKSNEYQVVKH